MEDVASQSMASTRSTAHVVIPTVTPTPHGTTQAFDAFNRPTLSSQRAAKAAAQGLAPNTAQQQAASSGGSEATASASFPQAETCLQLTTNFPNLLTPVTADTTFLIFVDDAKGKFKATVPVNKTTNSKIPPSRKSRPGSMGR
jgi:hypothetical protein